VVDGGGTRQQRAMCKRANVSPKTLTQTNFYNLTLGGPQISNICLVTNLPLRAQIYSPSIGIGLIALLPKADQPSDCTWDSLFSGLPPVRPHGIAEEARFELGKSVISRSSDVCSEGSWVFYNTHDVRSIVTILSLRSLTASDRVPFKGRTHL